MIEGWRESTLGGISVVQSGAGFPKKFQGLNSGDYPFAKVSDMNLLGNERHIKTAKNWVTDAVRLTLKAKLFPVGSCIFPKIGAAIATNKKRIVATPCCVDNNVIGLIPDTSIVTPEFLYYWLLHHDLSDFANDSELPSIRKSTVEQYPISIPTLLTAQERIVAVLDGAFEAIATATANTEKNLANARELRASRLGQLLAVANIGFGSERLGSIVDRLTNGYVGATRDIYQREGIPYLLARHVRDNRLTFDSRTYVSQEFNEKHKKSMLKAGDVLLVQSGHIGHSAVVPEEHHGHNCHAMIVITPRVDQLTGEYLSLCFNAPQLKRRFAEIRSGSTVPHLTCKAVKELQIPLPGIEAQYQTVLSSRRLSGVADSLDCGLRNKLAALTALRRSILQKAFSGELTAVDRELSDAGV